MWMIEARFLIQICMCVYMCVSICVLYTLIFTCEYIHMLLMKPQICVHGYKQVIQLGTEVLGKQMKTLEDT